jgi:hypothetical protein
MDIISTNNCSNCNKWNDGICNDGNWLEKKRNCGIYIYVHDDSGLYFELRTAPDFGCIKFKKR